MDRADSIQVVHVDDDPDFAELTAKFVQRKDQRINIHTTTKPGEAIDRIKTSSIDCVVSDYDMPQQSGIEFLETLREEFPELPFILYTGKGSEAVASEAISKGVTDYLQKQSGTSQYEMLTNRIRNYVEARRAENEREAMRERMDLALEYSNSIIFEIDLQTEKVTRLGQFEHVFDLDSDEVPTIDDYMTDVVHPGDRDEFRQFYRELTVGSRMQGSLEYRTNTQDEDVRWIRDQIHVEVENERRALGLAQDITEQKNRERELQETKADLETAVAEKERQNQAFHDFHDIITDSTQSFDQEMADVLALGVDFLDLDIGIISSIDPPDYRVEHVVTPGGSIEQGDVLDYSNTFCSLVYESEEPVAFRSPDEGEVEDHPCYQDLGLQAYLGEPLFVDGQRYGTLNFSSPKRRDEPFTDGERAFIRTVSEWVTTEIGRQQHHQPS